MKSKVKNVKREMKKVCNRQYAAGSLIKTKLKRLKWENEKF
jgi:hypothetical protein